MQYKWYKQIMLWEMLYNVSRAATGPRIACEMKLSHGDVFQFLNMDMHFKIEVPFLLSLVYEQMRK